MEEWKKRESGNADVHERREKGETAGSEKESPAMRRANIAGESYVSPKEASPAYAPVEEMTEIAQQEKGGKAVSPREASILRRSNIAGESFEKPVETSEPRVPGKKSTDDPGRQGNGE